MCAVAVSRCSKPCVGYVCVFRRVMLICPTSSRLCPSLFSVSSVGSSFRMVSQRVVFCVQRSFMLVVPFQCLHTLFLLPSMSRQVVRPAPTVFQFSFFSHAPTHVSASFRDASSRCFFFCQRLLARGPFLLAPPSRGVVIIQRLLARCLSCPWVYSGLSVQKHGF